MDFYKDDVAGTKLECCGDNRLSDRFDRDDRRCRRDYDDRKCHHDCDVRLSANTGGVGPLPIISTLFADPLSVVDTTINTEGMKKPAVLLTFTGIISLPIGIAVTLNFQIRRSLCDGPAVRIGSQYTFSTIVTVLEAEAFSFQYLDSNAEPGNYTYAVELSTNSFIEVTPGLTILNATLSALAVDRDC